MDRKDLIIKGKRYSWTNLHNLPQNISTHTVSSHQDTQHYRFFGEFNPSSNFHPSPFKHEGISYTWSEQYIQAFKASLSGDTEVLEQIMQAPTPLMCKNLGKEVKNCDMEKWNQAASEMCYPGLLEKFKQKPGLSNFLKNTADKTLLECCYDEVWGNGVPLTNPQCIDPNSYKNQGILGEMLEKINLGLKINQDTPSHLAKDNQTTNTNCEPLSAAGSDLPVQT